MPITKHMHKLEIHLFLSIILLSTNYNQPLNLTCSLAPLVNTDLMYATRECHENVTDDTFH